MFQDLQADLELLARRVTLLEAIIWPGNAETLYTSVSRSAHASKQNKLMCLTLYFTLYTLTGHNINEIIKVPIAPTDLNLTISIAPRLETWFD